MLDADRLAIVDYEITIEEGIGAPWEVRKVDLAEGLSKPFTLRMDLLSEDLGTDTEELIGAGCCLEILRGSLLRAVAGVVKAVEYVGVTHGRLLVRVEVVPAFDLLRWQVDSRIFQDVTAIEVIENVLEAGLGDYGRKVDTGQLGGEYDKRDYCVQFRESTFDFVSRLLEEEGIAYRFEFDDESEVETMVLVDDNATYQDIDTVVGDEVPIVADRADHEDRESLLYFDWRRIKRTNAVSSRGFNWKAPPAIDEGDAEYDGPKQRVLEVYEHDDRRHIIDDAADEGFDGTSQQRKPIAERRAQMYGAQTRVGRGRGNVTGFAPGMVFTLGEHARPDLDGGRFLITRVFHAGDCSDREGDVAVGERYLNSFECIPIDQPYRPHCGTATPRIYGAQTAVVTGPDGEEVHTDKHGRVKVWFPWDRLQAQDDGSSCWVRTMQSWAGKSFGAWVLPRVGMEVLVTFVDGNPDRPVVTGCVYNGDNGLPYPMPDEKSKSTFKTESTPGGDGFNELRFEDAKGKEEVFVHAQKDLTIKVLNDTNTTIDKNECHHVGADRKVTVVGNQIIEVQGKPPGGGGGFKGSSCAVTGDYKVTASSTAYLSAPSSITLECPGSSIKLEPGKITLSAGPGASVVLDANALVKSAAGSELFLDGNALTKSSAGSSVLLDGNACMSATGGGSVLLDANAKISGAGATALYDANATIKGGVATVVSTGGGCLNLTANADLTGAVTTCAGAGASCKLDGGAALTGGKVDIGGGPVNIG